MHCEDCAQYLCANCLETHSKARNSRQHQVIHRMTYMRFLWIYVRIGDQFKSPCFCSYGLYSSPPHFTSLTRISYYILLFIPAEKTRGEPIRAEPLSAVPRRWSVPKPKRTEPKKKPNRTEQTFAEPKRRAEAKRAEPSRAETNWSDPSWTEPGPDTTPRAAISKAVASGQNWVGPRSA